MPTVKSVGSLQECSATTILNIVCDRFQGVHDNNTDVWCEDLYNLILYSIPNSYEDFFIALLERLELIFSTTPSLRPKIRKLIPAMLGNQLKSLDFNVLSACFDKVVMKDVYTVLDSCCPNLERLSLGQSFFFSPDLISDLSCKLQKFNKLVSLKLLHVGTSDMLRNLGTNCPKLLQLSVRGSAKVCDSCVPDIIGCTNLRALDIQGTKISGEGRLEIMEKSERIEVIYHCPYNCDTDFRIFKSRAEIFDLIKKSYNGELTAEEPVARTIQDFRLKNFWLSNPKTEELVYTVVFPVLDTLRLDFVFQDMDFSLDPTPLRSLPNLRTLDLNFYDNHRNNLFRGILKACGKELTTLIYNVFAEYRSVIECHNIIATECPNLVSLSFQGDYSYTAGEEEEVETVLLAHSQEHPAFHTKLEELSLGGHCTDGRLAWILASASRIQRINLDGDLENLTNTSWFNIYTNNKLQDLESLWLNTSTSMGLESISLLVDNCPKLRRVGRLVNLSESLAGKRRSFYTELEERARKENLDLDFVWVSPRRRFKDGFNHLNSL